MKASLEMQDLANAQMNRAMVPTCGEENHFVHLYEDDNALSAVVADYLGAGLHVGECAVAIMTETHRRALCRELNARGVDVATACASGQLTLLDARETLTKLMAGRSPSRELFERTMSAAIDAVLAKHGGRHVRAYGEMVDLLFRDGKPRAALRLEALWSEFQTRYSLSLLCGYSMDYVCSDGADLHRVCAAHSRVLEPSRMGQRTKPLCVAPQMQQARLLLSEIAKRKEAESALRDCAAELRALSVRSQLLSADTQQAHRRAGLMCELASTISRATDLDALLPAALDVLAQGIGVDRSAVVLAADERLDFRAVRGLSDSYRQAAPRRLPSISDEGGSEPRLIADVDCDRALSSYLPVFRAEQIAAITTIPLACGGQQLGQLLLFYSRPHTTSASELEFARAIADQLASAVTRFACCAELARSERLGQLFASVLGHDLRNQLAPIMMGAKLAADRAQTDGLLRPLTTVLNSGERMVRMIDQLLELTHLRGRSGVPLSATRVDLKEVVHQVIDELDDANPEWLLVLSEEGGDTEGSWDADRISQVFFNLVSNAVEHGDSEHGVHVRVDGRDADVVSVEVHSGGRIRPAIVPRLFEPLTGTERGRGLGLGLHISREIVRAHGGQIEVQSSDDAGTMFRVSLPRAALCASHASPSEFFAQN